MLEAGTLPALAQMGHLLSAAFPWPSCGHLSPEISSMYAAARDCTVWGMQHQLELAGSLLLTEGTCKVMT